MRLFQHPGAQFAVLAWLISTTRIFSFSTVTAGDAHASLAFRSRRSPPLLGVALLGAILASGCNEAPGPAPADPAQGSASVPAVVPGTSRLSKEQTSAWLVTDLPPLVQDISATPVKFSDPQLSANEFGQEVLKVAYERPAVVRTLPREVNLVLLPVSGGRVTVFVNNGILIEPRSGGHIHGIVGNLLNHRGRLRSGIRAYLEMRAASIQTTATKPERVSDVIWIGSEDQLSAAVAKGPPPTVASNAGWPEPSLQAVPAGRIAKGTPLWMQCGDRWARGNALEDRDGEQIRLLIYLVRRDKPYLPWSVDKPRSELRIEAEALVEFQKGPNSFRDLADANDLKLSRHGVPNELKPVNLENLAVGTAVLDYWNGMLDPCRTTAPVKDGAVAIQRVGLDNAQMVKSTKQLFIDPFGEPAAATSPSQ